MTDERMRELLDLRPRHRLYEWQHPVSPPSDKPDWKCDIWRYWPIKRGPIQIRTGIEL